MNKVVAVIRIAHTEMKRNAPVPTQSPRRHRSCPAASPPRSPASPTPGPVPVSGDRIPRSPARARGCRAARRAIRDAGARRCASTSLHCLRRRRRRRHSKPSPSVGVPAPPSRASGVRRARRAA